MDKKNLLKRIITGSLGAGLLLFCSIYSQYSYLLIFIAIIFFSSKEFYRILKENNINPNNYLGTFLSVLIFISTFIYASQNSIWGVHFLLVPILPIVCLSALYASGNRDSLSNVSMTFFGIFYISIPISLLNFLVFESLSRKKYMNLIVLI